MPVAPPVDVRLVMSRVAVGVPMYQDERSHYGIFNQAGAELYSAINEPNGRIIFPDVRFTNPGMHHYTIRETFTPAGWDPDTRIWPVHIDVTHHIDDDGTERLLAMVNYPEGVPLFISVRPCTTCGSIAFPELTFDAPGVYEYTMKEETPSGDGWITDDKVIRVTIIVEDDGHGHLVALIQYPDGFPEFTNTYTVTPARIKITGCKYAIGAPLPAGKFTFGLYDEAGNLVATTTNGPADEKK